MAKAYEYIKRAWVIPRQAHARRKRTNSTFYNSQEWRKFRRLFIIQNPLCQECLKEGIETDITGKRKGVVDHIVPINSGGAKWDTDNLQALCNKCHNRKSGKEAHPGAVEP